MNVNEQDKKIINPFGSDKDFAGCSIFGMLNLEGKRFSSKDPVRAISNMHERSNGLGGGFAVYGIYPDLKDYYALHVMYLSRDAKDRTDRILASSFDIIHDEKIKTRQANVIAPPPDIADYFCLDDYAGFLWSCHGRFPTNTPGWWGGAHPFNVLDWTVVHNGEISSYGINRRHLEQFGYNCTMQTDTEVIAYAVDLLIRRHGLPVEMAAGILAPPFWSQIERCSPEKQKIPRTLRQVYGNLLLNGPFTVIIAHQGEMIGLTDRVRLRPLTVGVEGSVLYLSSEDSAIRLVCPDLDRTWIPIGGEPIIGSLERPFEPAVTARGPSDMAISNRGYAKISK